MLLLTAIQRFDLLSWVRERGGQQVQDDEWELACPGCGKPKLMVNTERKQWHCWVCERYEYAVDGRRVPVSGAGGLPALIQWWEGCDRASAENQIMMAAEYTPLDIMQISDWQLKQQMAAVYKVAASIPFPESMRPIEYEIPYLRKRGVSVAEANAFRLGICETGRYANRLIYPVYEAGRLVYYQGRAMWEATEKPGERYLKALNPPAMEGALVSSEVLFNVERAVQHERVVITEGPMDAIHVGEEAVCTFGKKISPIQIEKLRRLGVQKINLMWDGPSAKEPQGARPEMFRMAPLLASVFAEVWLTFLPQYDPGTYTRDQLRWFMGHRDYTRLFNRASAYAAL